MSTKRALIASVILAVLGWVVWVASSLRHVGDSLPDLATFELQRTQTQGAEASALAAPVDSVQPPVVSSSSPAGTDDAEPAIELNRPEGAGMASAVTAWSPRVAYRFLGTNPSIEARCQWYETAGEYIPETQVDPDIMRGFSDEEFQALVDSRDDDGMLQRAYAQSLRTEPWSSLEDDATTRDYDIRAVRGRDRASAAALAIMYYYVDRIESNAWWRIALEMGAEGRGGLAAWVELRGQPPYSDQESRDGADRADELINEFELLSGLGTPEDCLTAEKLAEQRSHQAALVRRLAQRAMPSAAPDAPAQAFNRLNGHALVVENVCSFSCPTDVERVIYYQDVPDTDACSEIDGVQRTIQARTPDARCAERTFCVPAFLAEN